MRRPSSDSAVFSLRGISDAPRIADAPRLLAREVTLDIPPGNYALLARDPLVARHLIDLLAGVRPPQQGRISAHGRVSWPVARPGFIRGKVTGPQIISFVARMYGLDLDVCMGFMNEMLTDPEGMGENIEHWPPVLRMEFNHALALLPVFDVYIVDGVFPYGDRRFTRLWRGLFAARSQGKTTILFTSRLSEAREHCTQALVLDNGSLSIEDLETALCKFPPRPLMAAGMAEQPANDEDARDGLI